MKSIEEDYVSFEIAKLLKEKGFHEPCYGSYSYRGGNVRVKTSKLSNTDLCYHPDISGISAPTLQMAMKWLRKKHNILLFILPAQENGKLVYLVEVWTWNEEEGIYESTYASSSRKEPEQACETAIKYCLEYLI